MIPLFPASVSGARRTGLFSWHATTDDPHVVYSFPLLRPHYCVLLLTSVGDVLDPVLYLDRGSGFSETEAHELKSGDLGIYAVSLTGLPDVRRIRLDPAARPVRFRLRAVAAYSARALGRIVGRALRRAGQGLRPAPVCEIVGEQGDRHGLPPGLFKNRHFKGTEAHYLKVLTMAAVMPQAPTVQAGPILSFVVPVFNTPPRYLDDLLGSFHAQPAGTAELVLSDDGSTAAATRAWLADRAAAPGVTVVRHDANRGIAVATNAGIAAARGAWVGLVDHDDALSPFAVPRILDALARKPDAAFLYTDEAITDASLTPVGYHLKPAYDPVLLSGVNYINHLSLYRRDGLVAIGGLRQGFEGSQDYDLLLRYLAGVDSRCVVHLPFPAYLWRRHKQSFSTTALDQALANARRALGEHYGSAAAPLSVEAAIDPNLHRVRFDTAIGSWPKVSIVVPSRDSYDLIARLIDDLTTRTDYPDREIIVIDNGSTDPRVLELYRQTQERDPAFRVDIRPAPFNFSRQVNRGIELAAGEHILLLNNDVEVRDSRWLREMVSCLAYHRAGIVGARLLYPDLTLQHAGVIVGLAGLAGHWYHRKPQDYPGMLGRLNVRQSLSAVTAACMLISRACLDDVGRLDEAAFAIAYNDVDYCMRAVGLGYRVVWTPFAELIHHESVSRGSDETPANIERFGREKAALRERHRTDLYMDPAFSPWFSRNHSEPRLVLLDHLPEAR